MFEFFLLLFEFLSVFFSPFIFRGPTVDEVVKGSALYKIGPVAVSKCVELPFVLVTVAVV